MYTKREFVGVGASTAITLGLVFSASFAAIPAFAQTADDYGISAAGTYCPTLSTTMQRGARDISTNNQVSELQKFLADYYDIDPTELVTGYFGRITQGYVIQFQKEQGLPTFGIAGSLTRAAIARVCNQTQSTQTSTNTQTNTSSASLVASPISGIASLAVTFSANLEQTLKAPSDGTIQLDYGDGQQSTLCKTNSSGIAACTTSWSGQHTYASAGTYVAKLMWQYTTGSTPLGTATVTVTSQQSVTPAPTLNFYVYPTTIVMGQSAALNWMTTNASSCVSTGSTMPYPLGVSGNIQVSPVKGAVYTLVCTGSGGSVTQSVTVDVISAPSISSVNGKGGFGIGDSNYILGQAFSLVKEVYLQSSGGVKIPLSYTLVDDTRLNVVVPTISNDNYYLYVVNQAGVGRPYSLGYLGATPLPVISSVNGKGGFGPGDSNSIYGQNFSTTKEVYLQSSGGIKTSLSYTIAGDIRLDVVVPSLSSGSYQLYVVNQGGNAAYTVSF